MGADALDNQMKQNRVTICRRHLQRFYEGGAFLRRIATW